MNHVLKMKTHFQKIIIIYSIIDLQYLDIKYLQNQN